MEKKIQKFIDPVKKVSLSFQEKSDLRNRILLEMNQPILIYAPNIFERTRILFGSFRPAYAMALLLVFVLSGGGSFAAEGALPGNFLYPIKVKVNEKISGIFAVGSLKKAERESELIDKRLEEVKVLSKSGELSDEKIKIVEDQISIHTKNSRGHIVALEEKKDFEGALRVQAKLESSLKVNEKIITDANKKDKNIDAIALQAKEELSQVSNKKDSIEKTFEKEKGFDVAIVSELKLKTARLALLEAIDVVEKESEDIEEQPEGSSGDAKMMSLTAGSEIPVLSPDEKILKLIELKIATGEIYLRNLEHEKATKLFEEAYQLSRNLILSPEGIESQEQLDIELQKQESKPVSVNLDETSTEEELKEIKNVEKKSEVKGEFKSKSGLKDKREVDTSSVVLEGEEL